MNTSLFSLLATSMPSGSASGTPPTEDLSQDPGLGPGLVPPSNEREGAAPPVLRELTSGAEPSQQHARFVAVTGAEGEQTSATTTVVLAYGLFWLIVFILVFRTFRSQERLQARMTELEQRLPKEPAA